MLAIVGSKGSSGKTTTTLGLTSALDGPVLAVDADRDVSNLHTTAGAGRPTDVASGAPARESSARSHPTDSIVFVLSVPTGTDDDAFERWLRTAAGDERRTAVDCPAGAGPDVTVPFRTANGVAVVSPLCVPALRDVAKTAVMMWALDALVVGCVTSRSRVAPEAMSDLVGAPALGTTPEESSPVLTRLTVRAAYRRITDKIPGKK